MKTDPLTVNSQEELIGYLQKIDISHPPVWQGATKEQIERAMAFLQYAPYIAYSPQSY